MTTMHRRGILLSVAIMWFVGGSIYPFLSEVAKKVDTTNIIFIRSVGAASVMFLAVLFFDRHSFKLLRFDKRLIPIVISSILFSPICSATLAWSSSRVPGAVTALVYSTLPAMAVVYLAIKGKLPSRRSGMGVALASIAVAFLVGAPNGPVSAIGVLAALVSVFAWFAATEIWIKYESNYPLLLAIFLQVFIGSIGTGILRLVIGAPPLTRDAILDVNMIFLIFALASQYWAYLALTRNVSAGLLTSFAFVNPLVAGIVGFIAFDQKVGSVQIIAGAILLIGVFLVVREDLKKVR
jgi:drug/metabolite transporter (DMT)-like permease